MAGTHIARLQGSIVGMDPDDVATSRTHWDETARALRTISSVLDRAEASILEGFGPGSAIATAAGTAFSTMRSQVLEPRETEMQEARAALDVVQVAMTRARAVNAQMPSSAPGPAPTFTAGTGDEADDVTRLKIHAAQMRAHHQQAAAYGDSDEQARHELVALNRDYDEAAEVMARIHGEPVRESGPGTPGSTGGGAGGPGSGSAHGAGASSSSDGGQSATIDVAFPTGGDSFEVSPTPGGSAGSTPYSSPQGTPDTIDSGTTRADVGTGGSGLNPIAGGAAAGAGALGGLGAKNLIARLGSAAPGGTAAGGTPARPVGTTGRAASSGVLGGSAARGAAGTTAAPGSQATGRGASAGAGAGAGAGARAGAGAAGRRGRTTDPQGRRENDLEVEEDWLDDEGHSGVLD